MKLLWYRATLNMGHVGAGKSIDEEIYIQAPNAVAAMAVVGRFPGAKKSRRGTYGNSLLPVEGELPAGARKWWWNGKR